MKSRRVTELFGKERHLRRSIRRKLEHYDELVAEATSTGSLRYDQDKVIGSAPEGSRQDKLVPEYVELRKEISRLQEQLSMIHSQIGQLIAVLPPRERRVMYARHMQGESVERIMKQFGISYETYRVYHKTALIRMERRFEEVVESIPQI